MKYSLSLPQEMYGEQLGEHEYWYTSVIDQAWGQNGWILVYFFVGVNNNANIKAKNKAMNIQSSWLKLICLINKWFIVWPKSEL